MGFFSKLLGLNDDTAQRRSPRDVLAGMGTSPMPNDDAQAIERYRYMLRTAPPETLEQAHAEAFAKLTPDQRRQVLAQLTDAAPAAERASVASTSVEDPQALARVATRAEVRNPGTLERSLGATSGGGMGMAGSLLGSFAMGFAGSMVAQSLFSAMGGFGGDESASADEVTQAEDEAGYDDGDPGDGGDLGGGDFDI